MSIPRGWAGPSLLAMILFEKFGQHQPLNRQAERYALEGVPISLSTMADAVGAVCAALDPLLRLVEAHVLAAERLHGDDTTVPVLAKGKTDTADAGSMSAMTGHSGARRRRRRCSITPATAKASIRSGIWPAMPAFFQADAFDGYRQLYLPEPKPGPDRGGSVLGPRPAPVLCHGRPRGECATQGGGQEGDRALSHRDRGGAPHRRPVRHRAARSMAKPAESAGPFARN